jgi:4-amino-4-deoxy-L-arabinose transferase-like glycosyltransferase
LRGYVFFAVALIVGAVLRLANAGDMEYKADEAWTFEASQRIGHAEPWPAVGMTSSVGAKNPGMSVWVFVALARIAHVHTPVGLGRAVMGLNVLALLLLFLFTVTAVPPREREAWLWAGAFAAVSPIAVVLERKIWPPSVFPAFCVMFLLGWWRRDRRWGALLWGFAGALLGQIQMSGFLLAAALAAWVAVFGRRRLATRWPAWGLGSLAGALPLVPWLGYLATEGGAAFTRHSFWPALELWPTWFADALGLSLYYKLRDDYASFLRWGMYLPVLLQMAALLLGVYVLVAALRAAWRARARLWPLRALAAGCSETAFLCSAGFLGFGGLLALVGSFHPHYMIVLFPVEWLLFAALALGFASRPRLVLSLAWAAQLAITVSFLSFIHQNGGAPGGDYGRSYESAR